MKIIAKLNYLLFFLASTLFAAEVDRPNATDIPNQHTVVISLAALFYCGLDRWPEDLTELKKFQAINEIKLGVDSNWPWLTSSEFIYEAGDEIVLYSESPNEEGNIVKVNSGQKKPICKDGNTEMQGAHLNVDFGDEDT